MVEGDFYSAKEFAALIGVHPNTVRRAIKTGRISAFRVGTGKRSSWRIAKTEASRLTLFDMEAIVEKVLAKKAARN